MSDSASVMVSIDTMAKTRHQLGFDPWVPHGESERFAREIFLNRVLAIRPEIGFDLLHRGERGLAAWSQQWHLSDRWVLEVARLTLEVYDHDVRTGGAWEIDRFAWPDDDDYPEWGPADTFSLDWAPDAEPEQHFRHRIKLAIERAVDEHIRRRTTAAYEAGLRPATVRAQAPFDWLAKYQCAEWGYTRIAKARMREDGEDVNDPDLVNRRVTYTIDAVRKLSAFIGLTLRPSPRGRHSHASAHR